MITKKRFMCPKSKSKFNQIIVFVKNISFQMKGITSAYVSYLHTLKNAGLFQPKFGSNMDEPKCWVKMQLKNVQLKSGSDLKLHF